MESSERKEETSKAESSDLSEPENVSEPVIAYEWDCLTGMPVYDGTYGYKLTIPEAPIRYGELECAAYDSPTGLLPEECLHSVVAAVLPHGPGYRMSEEEQNAWKAFVTAWGLPSCEEASFPVDVCTYRMTLSYADMKQLFELAHDAGYSVLFTADPESGYRSSLLFPNE